MSATQHKTVSSTAMPNGLKCIVAVVCLLVMLPLLVSVGNFAYYLIIKRYTPIDAYFSVVEKTDTSWAKDYSESNFNKVKIGMTQDEVRKIMGEPVRSANGDYWGYTESPSSTHYHQRGFVFSPSGSVTQIVKGFYFD